MKRRLRRADVWSAYPTHPVNAVSLPDSVPDVPPRRVGRSTVEALSEQYGFPFYEMRMPADWQPNFTVVEP